VNIESRINDGLAAPLVLFFLSAAVRADYAGSLIGQALADLGIALGGILPGALSA
jgi:NhaP-type Na+/H+ or K+/H+ antiporter